MTFATLTIPVHQSSFAQERLYLDNILLKPGNTFTYTLPEVTEGIIYVKLFTRRILPNPDRSDVLPDIRIHHESSVIRQTSAREAPFSRVFSGKINKSGIGYKISVKNVNNGTSTEDYPNGEKYRLLVLYPGKRRLATKKIPLSFIQRSFDNFWNTYKPIQNIQFKTDHDRVIDQYSIGEVLEAMRDPFHSTPSYLSTDDSARILSKYAASFNHINVFDHFGEVIERSKNEFRATISELARDHTDSDLQRVYREMRIDTNHSLFNLFKKVISEDVLNPRISTKAVLTFSPDIAKIYNRSSAGQVFLKRQFQILDFPYLRANNINITSIELNVLTNTRHPGISLKAAVESGGPAEFSFEAFDLSVPLFDVHKLEVQMEVVIKTYDAEPDNLENIEKKLKFECTSNCIVEPNEGLPGNIASVAEEVFDSIHPPQELHSVEIAETVVFVSGSMFRMPIQDVVNWLLKEFVEQHLYELYERIVSFLLGENYPIVDLWQMGDNMMISYLSRPEKGNFNLITAKPYIPKDNLRKFDHIVILMQENRSFDHMLGYLKVDSHRDDVEGLTGNEFNLDRRGNRHFVHRANSTQIKQDPCHASECVAQQIGESMDGFVKNFELALRSDNEFTLTNLKKVMSYYGQNDVGTFDYIANNFAICDRWFCAHPGQTLPNRFIAYTGKLNTNSEGATEIDNIVFNQFTPVETLTIFDYLTKCSTSWKVFEHGYSFLRLFSRYTYETNRIVDFNNTENGFMACARNGNLPAVTFIEPDYIDQPPGNDDHPPGDIKHGQQFMARIIRALQDGPKWEKTLLLITYDEHGGFYDHVPPPNDAVALSRGLTRYGPRVPALVVSPYVPAKTVSHDLFDHTTILATIVRRFIHPDNYRYLDLGPRYKQSNDLGALLTLDTPRNPGSGFEALTVPRYNHSNFTLSYRMNLPDFKSNKFHETLLGYRILLGFPPK